MATPKAKDAVNFIENETAEKLRGGYYTHPDIAQYLTRWVLASQPQDILEPSCGDGAFLRAMASMRHASVKSVTACEIDAKEAVKARRAGTALRAGVKCQVNQRDFLEWTRARLPEPPQFDAVIGNPPFIRYQYLDEALQGSAEKLIRGLGLRFTKHTNAWVPFVVGALALLRPGGRLAMVVPSEILHVLHADSVRAFLLRECSKVLILDPEEIWFEETLQGVVLLLAEKRSAERREGAGLGEVAITSIRGREFLAEDPADQFKSAHYIDGEQLAGKWMVALLSARERASLVRLEQHKAVARFRDVASAAVGIVTGANKFFLVPDAVVRDFGLEAFAHPMFGRSEHVAGVVYDARNHRENKQRGFPTNFIWIDGTPKSQLPPSVRRYIERGEAEKLHTRFKCRIREPWYAVPSVFTAPVGMLKRCHDHPRLVLNTLDAFTTDTAYRITVKKGTPRRLVYAFVNSLTALSAELEGRHYGGGVLELVPSEISRLLLPLPGGVEEDVDGLDAAFRAGRSVVEILEMQDRKLLGALGLSGSERAELMSAWWKLRNRRHRSPSETDAASAELAASAGAG